MLKLYRLRTQILFWKASKDVPEVGELNPEIVTHAIQKLLNISYEPRPADYAQRVHEAASELVQRERSVSAQGAHTGPPTGQ